MTEDPRGMNDLKGSHQMERLLVWSERAPVDGAGVEPVNNTRDLAFDGKARKLSLQSAIGGVKAGAVLFGLVEMLHEFSAQRHHGLLRTGCAPRAYGRPWRGAAQLGRWSLCAPMGLE